MRGCFVTGTDTGVGKTVLAAAIIAALRARGVDAAGFKPVITGLGEASDPDWPPDHELLARISERDPAQVTAVGFDPPVSPHLAAQLAGRELVAARLVKAARSAGAGCDALVVEGVGGLLVPLAPGFDVRALARELALPLVIAARPGLGTINHTLLTLQAARAVGLTCAGVVLAPWPAAPDRIEFSNRETIARLGGVAVSTLPPIARAEPALLAAAGAGLPIDDWLAAASIT